MFPTLKIGFLFDVDGTLTYYRGNDSTIDLLIVNDLEQIRKQKFPIGLVTGRSVDWVREIFFNHVNSQLREYLHVSGEFGLVSWHNGKKTKSRISKELKSILSEVKNKLIDTISTEKELEPVVSYTAPDRRCLWIEPKEIMITFRTLPSFGLTIDVYQKIITPILAEYQDYLKLIGNPYAADILPIKASKKNAAEKTIVKLDPNNLTTKWYAFGDSESDKEMSLAKGKNVKFYMISRGDTSQAHNIISRILIGKE